jgi:hypothetical protein
LIEARTATAEELADALAEQHGRWFDEHPDGSILQSVLVVPEEGDAMVLGCPWNGPHERDAIIHMLRVLMHQASAVRYAVWAEVWIVKEAVQAGDDPKAAAEARAAEYELGDLEQHPQRIEAVFTIVVDASGTTASRLQPITRGPDKAVVRLEPAETGYGGLGGALANLLPKRTVN